MNIIKHTNRGRFGWWTLNKTLSNNLLHRFMCAFLYFAQYLFKSVFSEAKRSKNHQINHVIITCCWFSLLLLLFVVVFFLFAFFALLFICADFKVNCLLMLKQLLVLHLVAIILNMCAIFQLDIWLEVGLFIRSVHTGFSLFVCSVRSHAWPMSLQKCELWSYVFKKYRTKSQWRRKKIQQNRQRTRKNQASDFCRQNYLQSHKKSHMQKETNKKNTQKKSPIFKKNINWRVDTRKKLGINFGIILWAKMVAILYAFTYMI